MKRPVLEDVVQGLGNLERRAGQQRRQFLRRLLRGIDASADRTATGGKPDRTDDRESGDPAKLARALITIASGKQPPRRFIAGADALATVGQKIADLKTQIEAHREPARDQALGVNT